MIKLMILISSITIWFKYGSKIINSVMMISRNSIKNMINIITETVIETIKCTYIKLRELCNK